MTKTPELSHLFVGVCLWYACVCACLLACLIALSWCVFALSIGYSVGINDIEREFSYNNFLYDLEFADHRKVHRANIYIRTHTTPHAHRHTHAQTHAHSLGINNNNNNHINEEKI